MGKRRKQKEIKKASIDRLIEPVMRYVGTDWRSLLQEVLEAVDSCRFEFAERLLRDDGIDILRRSMEMLLSSVEQPPLPKVRPCPAYVIGRLKTTGLRAKLLDTSLGSMRIRRRRFRRDSDPCRHTV